MNTAYNQYRVKVPTILETKVDIMLEMGNCGRLKGFVLHTIDLIISKDLLF